MEIESEHRDQAQCLRAGGHVDDDLLGDRLGDRNAGLAVDRGDNAGCPGVAQRDRVGQRGQDGRGELGPLGGRQQRREAGDQLFRQRWRKHL